MTGNYREKKGNTEWEADWDSGTLTIFGYGKMTECDEYELPDRLVSFAPWDYLAPMARNVVIQEGITSICAEAFNGFLLLESVKIPDSVKSIGKGAFRACASLKSVEIPAGVEEIDMDCFPRCFALEEINVSRDNPTYCSENGVLFTRDGTLIQYPQKKRDEKYRVPEGTRTIATRAMVTNGNLRTLVFPEGFEEVGSNAVQGLWNLEVVEFPASLKKISLVNSFPVREFRVAEENRNFTVRDGVLFSGDGKVLVAYPPKKEGTVYKVPEGVERIGGGAFYGADRLKKIVMPGTLEKIGSGAFGCCESLETIQFDHEPVFESDDFEYTFEGCGDIELIYGDGKNE